MMDSEQPGKIFVGGLSVDIDEKAMEDAFGKYGRITQILVLRDKITNKGRGYGFVTFENPLDSEDAIAGMEGQTLDGKELHCEPAVKPRSDMDSRRRGTGFRGRGSLRGRPDRGPPSGGYSSRGRSERGPPGGFSSGPRSSLMQAARSRLIKARTRGSSMMSSRGRGGPSRSYRRSMSPPRSLSPIQRAPPAFSPRGRPRGGGARHMSPGYDDSPPRRSSFRERESRISSSSVGRRDPFSMPQSSSSTRGRSYSGGRDFGGPDSGRRESRPLSSRDSFSNSRDYPSSRDFGPTARSYSPPPLREYSTTSREFSDRPQRNRSLGGRDMGSYSTMRDSPRDEYMSTSSSRPYGSSRELGSPRELMPRDYGGSRPLTSSRDYESGRGGSMRDYDAPPRSISKSSMYASGGGGGPPSRSYGQSSSRDSMSYSAPGESSRSSYGTSYRGQSSSRGGRYSPDSRGPPPRDSYSVGTRRPSSHESRGPPIKRSRPDTNGGPPRGRGRPFRR